jgi:YfiH family protein
MTADCLPVLLADEAASVIGIAHAGWRGLALGVIEATLQQMKLKAPAATRWYAYLGPAIGPQHFEVGSEVKDIFVSTHPQAATAFTAVGSEGKYLANLYALARQALTI